MLTNLLEREPEMAGNNSLSLTAPAPQFDRSPQDEKLETPLASTKEVWSQIVWRQIVWCGATSATVALMLPCSQIMIFMRFKTCPNLKQGLVNSTGQINRRRERRVVEDNSQSTRVIVSLVQDYLLGAGFDSTENFMLNHKMQAIKPDPREIDLEYNYRSRSGESGPKPADFKELPVDTSLTELCQVTFMKTVRISESFDLLFMSGQWPQLELGGYWRWPSRPDCSGQLGPAGQTAQVS
ncbi:hypothetical protein RRG08_062721 [Elysia crispata]|uniref:Uncharacterized protein n=1 Tax=Elysia crispata TaxID=231223 RepID=A0AAE1AE30_9GAST|nr:hypothetical protein RRG08_062721 [Elysia crispata]